MRQTQLDKTPLLLTPAYNAARHLPELVARVQKVYPLQRFLIVNDGSRDNSAAVLASLPVQSLSLRVNSGKGVALQTGYAWARARGYNSVISMDADLQHAPEELGGILEQHRIDRSAIVLGSRFVDHRGMPLDRLLSNNLTSIIISLFSGQRIRDSQSGFRLIPLAALQYVHTRTVGYMYESETLLKLGALGVKVREAPISSIYGDSVSFINPFRDTLRFIKLIWRRLWY